MSSLGELARQHAKLDRDDLAHLQRLVREWGMLADFCFADLLLYVPAPDGRWLVLGQVRPVTSQTLYQADWVGSWANESERPVLAAAWDSGRVAEGEVAVEGFPDPTRMVAVPVRRRGRLLAILTREWSPTVGRQPGELERTYLAIFRRFTDMIAAGSFPFVHEMAATGLTPRVGDGVMVLDLTTRVEYASPNAVSALHRAGINTNAIGLRLAELGFADGPVRASFDLQTPVTEEVEPTPDVVILVRSIPLLAGHAPAAGAGAGASVDRGEATGRAPVVTGGVLLLRDVSEVRRKDRLLLSKDATIREIHHRVKNNLQTISSLLRLQGRRLTSPEAKAAIDESVRRIRTIALVHETLSREAGDDIAFVEILRPLARMAEEGLQSPDRPVRFRVQGDGGKLPAVVATPLAVVLTELLQNAVDHAFRPGRADPGTVVVDLSNDAETLSISVIDDGVGVPEGFSLERATGLGLSIVRTLVTTELAGSIVMRPATAADLAEASLVAGPGCTGTVVALRVPLAVHAS
jgi:two-component sensor histidine kinase